MISSDEAQSRDEATWQREEIDHDPDADKLLRQVLMDIQETPEARVSDLTITRIRDFLED